MSLQAASARPSPAVPSRGASRRYARLLVSRAADNPDAGNAGDHSSSSGSTAAWPAAADGGSAACAAAAARTAAASAGKDGWTKLKDLARQLADGGGGGASQPAGSSTSPAAPAGEVTSGGGDASPPAGGGSSPPAGSSSSLPSAYPPSEAEAAACAQLEEAQAEMEFWKKAHRKVVAEKGELEIKNAMLEAAITRYIVAVDNALTQRSAAVREVAAQRIESTAGGGKLGQAGGGKGGDGGDGGEGGAHDAANPGGGGQAAGD
ncbi:hypothetical protein ABPG75_000392 [Micractinium tetrahymenae]